MITIILAGDSEMIMNYPKIILKVKNIPMIVRTINNAILLGSKKIFITLHKNIKDQVINIIKQYVRNKNIFYIIHEQHSSKMIELKSITDFIKEEDPFEKIIVMPIDIPLLSPYTLLPFKQWKDKNDSRIFCCKLKNPNGFKRIIRDKKLNFIEIKEDNKSDVPYISTDIFMFRNYQLMNEGLKCRDIIEFINILKPSIYMLEDKYQRELIKVNNIETIRSINNRFGL